MKTDPATPGSSKTKVTKLKLNKEAQIEKKRIALKSHRWNSHASAALKKTSEFLRGVPPGSGRDLSTPRYRRRRRRNKSRT